MFTLGQEYTRDEIHERVGGSKQSYLPTRDGAVVAACLTQRLNPRAPEVVLCGRGPIIAVAGGMLAEQTEPVPVFLKRATNRWEYRGHFRADTSHTAGPDFDHLVSGSGRVPADVSRVVVLRPVP
jgi:hypothetical protein